MQISVTFPRDGTNVDLQRYYGQASLVTEWAKHGITFTRSGIDGGAGPWAMDDPVAYEEFWRHQMVLLDAAAASGMSLLINAGFDRLASCRSGWVSKQGPGSVDPCYLNGVPQPVAIRRTEAWVWDTIA